MNSLISDLKARFEELDPREQRALLLMSGFLLLVIFYLFIWSPVGSYKVEGQADYDRQLALFSYLKSTEPEARAVAGGASDVRKGGQTLLSSVSSAARSVGINPSRLQPEGENGVSVWFDTVTFTSLMRWLEKLESERGIVVSQLSIDSRDTAGQVSARLVLR
jgi:general secretion pathway protein M